MAIWPHRIESLIISVGDRIEFVAVEDVVNVATGDPDHPTTTRSVARIEPPDGYHDGWFVTVDRHGNALQTINAAHVAQVKHFAVDPNQSSSEKETESS